MLPRVVEMVSEEPENPLFMFGEDFKGLEKCCFSHTHDWGHGKAAVQLWASREVLIH